MWFANVAFEWELCFGGEELREGRRIYREGLISGVELSTAEAIVNCSFTRKDTCYAVVEWSKSGPSVRSSSDDIDLGRAVAVAGLYEIEELIADEIAPLPIERDRLAEESEQETELTLEEEEPEEEGREVRKLVLKISGLKSGLKLVASWEDGTNPLIPAFGADSGLPPCLERELLVKLTARSRDAGFIYRADSGDFLLKDAERIAAFFSTSREHWEESFGELELDLEAEIMSAGVGDVRVIGRVEAEGQENMRVDWRLRLGKRWLDPEDAERIVRAGKGMHIVSGLGLVRIGEDAAETLQQWQVATSKHLDEVKTWPRYMVFSLFAEHGAELDLEEELSLWREGLTGGEKSDSDCTELPDFLRDYQVQGVQWLANLRDRACHGLLADEMGLGKTLQIITLLNYFPIENKSSLIVCPAGVVPVWENEIRRWYPALHAKTLRKGNDFQSGETDEVSVWIASYTQLRRHKHLLDQQEFGYAVLDEAQQIKNPDAKVTQACCAIKAECRLALTGTPIENRLLDLWTLFRFLMPGLLGNRRRFEDLAELSGSKTRKSFEKRLRQQLAPFILRRKKEQVVDELPPKVEMDLICPLSETQRQRYQSLLDSSKEELGEDLQSAMRTNPMNFFTLLTRLRQVCCDPGLLPDDRSEIAQSGKVQTLMTRFDEALYEDGTRKIVVFSQFVQLLKRIRPEVESAFPQLAIYELTGQTRDRSTPVESFQNESGQAIMFVSLRAGGTGITLHAADYVFLLDPWWNPAVENQAVDRVHRIGQSKRVFVYRMITEGTIEQRIQQLKKEKRELFENTLGGLGSAKDLSEHFGDLEDLTSLITSE